MLALNRIGADFKWLDMRMKGKITSAAQIEKLRERENASLAHILADINVMNALTVRVMFKLCT